MTEAVAEFFHYRLIIFCLFLSSIVIALTGPLFYPKIYYRINQAMLIYYACKIWIMGLNSIVSYLKFKQSVAHQDVLIYSQTVHTFIIPNFKEEIQTLRKTLLNLSKHRNAKLYCVFLAMEAHEEGSKQKAEGLLSHFKDQFRILDYTLHELSPEEAKSKNSNINWCATHISQILLEKGVLLDDVMITIMDADSLIPDLYVSEMNRYISTHENQKFKIVFAPPQIFTINSRQVPFFIRTMDAMMSYLHFSNLYSFFNFSLAVSNYSISYRFLQKIGFWDTCIFSRAEDMRLPAKAYWKSEGDMKVVPIFAPINQMHVSTGEGYVSDFVARFQQAKRHLQGQIEVSYNFVHFMKRKFTLRNLHVFYNVLQVYVMLVIIPIPFIVLALQNFGILSRSELDDGTFFNRSNLVQISGALFGFIFYELIRRKATTEYFGMKNMNILHTFTIPIISSVFSIFFGFIPAVMGGYSLMKNQLTFTSAPKKAVAKDKSSGENPGPMIQFIIGNSDTEQLLSLEGHEQK